jgi:hypothetical protein
MAQDSWGSRNDILYSIDSILYNTTPTTPRQGLPDIVIVHWLVEIGVEMG